MNYFNQFKKCKVCKEKYNRRKNERTNDWKIRKFCSLKCSYIGRKSVKGRKHTKEAKKKIGLIHKGNSYRRGMTHTKEARKKISKARKKYFGRNHHRYGKKHSKESKKLMSKNRKNLTVGENNPNYIDGRSYDEYPKEFFLKRQYIKNRDNFICQNCRISEKEHNKKFGYKLDVHHINYNKKDCSENNLITLCRSCNSKANNNRDFWNKFYLKKVTKV